MPRRRAPAGRLAAWVDAVLMGAVPELVDLVAGRAARLLVGVPRLKGRVDEAVSSCLRRHEVDSRLWRPPASPRHGRRA